MSVPIEASSASFTGNGSTVVFPFTFRFKLNSEVVLKVTNPGATQTIYTEGLTYSLSGAGMDAGGVVTFFTAPVSTAAIVIERTVLLTQPVSLSRTGSYDPASIETALDEGAFVDQQLSRRISKLESSGVNFGSVVAGNGLTLAANILNVGAGAGIVANADDIAVSFGGAPSDVTKAAAAAGSASTVSRSDHKHDVSTSAAGTAAIADVAAEGTATSLTRSDHKHAFPAPAAPANVTKTAADAGAATTFARADHKHDITTAVAASLTATANAEGSASSLARSDHTHAHAVQSDPTLHALATSSTAGFMSGTDKTKLDALQNQSISIFNFQTVNGTPIVGATITMTNQSTEVVEFSISASKKTGSTAAGYVLMATLRCWDNIARIVGQSVLAADEDDPFWDATVRVSGSNADVSIRLVGAAFTIDWHIEARRRTVLSS